MRKYTILLLALLLMNSTTSAQDVPTQIDTALAALSDEVGQSVTLDDLTNWRWQTAQFNDASLGCGSNNQMAAQVITLGFIFFLEYQGEMYEYRVPRDRQIAVLCTNQDESADSESGVIETGGYSNTLCPPPAGDDPTFPRSRITLNLEVNTVTEVPLRDQPSPDGALVSTLAPATHLSVFSGPQCAAGRVWWQVDSDGTLGWISEVEGGSHVVDVRPPVPVPTTVSITVDNASTLVQLSVLQGNFFPRVAWSTDGTQLAVAGDRGLDSVMLYTGGALDAPVYIAQASRPTDLVFRTNMQQLIASRADGGIHLWDTATELGAPELLFLQTHEQVQAIAFNPINGQVASAGRDARTDRPIDRSFAISLWSIDGVQALNAFAGHTAVVLDLAFSPDGQQLAAVDANGDVIIHPANIAGNSTPIAGLVGRSLAYSSNGQFLAVGNLDGTISLLSATDGSLIATYVGHLSEVTTLAFSPDNTLLVSGATDGTIRVWNTQSDTLLAVIELTDGGVFDVAVSPNGQLIAAATDDNTVRLLGITSN